MRPSVSLLRFDAKANRSKLSPFIIVFSFDVAVAMRKPFAASTKETFLATRVPLRLLALQQTVSMIVSGRLARDNREGGIRLE